MLAHSVCRLDSDNQATPCLLIGRRTVTLIPCVVEGLTTDGTRSVPTTFLLHQLSRRELGLLVSRRAAQTPEYHNHSLDEHQKRQCN